MADYYSRSLYAGGVLRGNLDPRIPISLLTIDDEFFKAIPRNVAESLIKFKQVYPDMDPFKSFFDKAKERAAEINNPALITFMQKRGITMMPETYAHALAFTSLLHQHLQQFDKDRGEKIIEALEKEARDRNWPPPTMIERFNKGGIRCAEAAILFQLYTQHAGLNGAMVSGAICFAPSEGRLGNHALNVISDDNGMFFVDAINFCMNKGNVFRPRIYAVSNNVFAGWLEEAETRSVLLRLEEQHAPIKPHYELFGNVSPVVENLQGHDFPVMKANDNAAGSRPKGLRWLLGTLNALSAQ